MADTRCRARPAETVRLRVAARRHLGICRTGGACRRAQRVRVRFRRTLSARPALCAVEAEAAQTVRLRVAAKRRLRGAPHRRCTPPCPAPPRTYPPDTRCRALPAGRGSRGCRDSLSARSYQEETPHAAGTPCTEAYQSRQRSCSPDTACRARSCAGNPWHLGVSRGDEGRVERTIQSR